MSQRIHTAGSKKDKFYSGTRPYRRPFHVSPLHSPTSTREIRTWPWNRRPTVRAVRAYFLKENLDRSGMRRPVPVVDVSGHKSGSDDDKNTIVAPQNHASSGTTDGEIVSSRSPPSYDVDDEPDSDEQENDAPSVTTEDEIISPRSPPNYDDDELSSDEDELMEDDEADNNVNAEDGELDEQDEDDDDDDEDFLGSAAYHRRAHFWARCGRTMAAQDIAPLQRTDKINDSEHVPMSNLYEDAA